MFSVLGLDLAKTTGLAFGSRGGPWFWWEIALNPRGAIEGRHFHSFYKQLREELRQWKPELVLFEEVDFAKYLLAYRLNAILCGLVMVACESTGTPYAGVSVGTLKKFAGKGNAKKEQMREFAREKLFGSVIPETMPADLTTNEVDAIWLVQYGLEKARMPGRKTA